MQHKDNRQNKQQCEWDEYYLGSEQGGALNPYCHITENVDENLETEVDADDVDLSSFKKEDSLNPKIWKNDELNPKIRLKLLDIADDFWDSVDVSWVEPVDYVLMGSICNYNWSRYSDIDLHVLVDFSDVDEKTEFVQEYFDAKKNEWNDEHGDLTVFGFPVEMYIQDVNAISESGGIYSLEKNKWVKKPNKDDMHSIGPEKYSIKDKAAEIMTIIDDLEDLFHEVTDLHLVEKIYNVCGDTLKTIQSIRKDSLSKDGEMGSGNIVYKVLRRTEYLDKLYKLRVRSYDRMNSITESILSNVHKALIKEEVVADGNASHNPYKDRWKQEREDLKNYIIAYGKLMTSRENGKQYVVLYQPEISQLVGNSYGLCVQYDNIKGEYRSILYIRAMDKFTDQIFQTQFDHSGLDNQSGTGDDTINANQQFTAN